MSEIITVGLDVVKTVLKAHGADGSVVIPAIAKGVTSWPPHWPARALDTFEFGNEWRKWQADPTGYVPPP